MILSELLAHTTESFAGVADAPVAFALLTGGPHEWQLTETRSITGVRLGGDEVLVETDNLQHPGPLTVGELLARLQELVADHSDLPVEACEPEIDAGDGTRVRIDYSVDGSGRDESTGTCLLVHLAKVAPA
jgi:hypothetical protein